MTTGLARRGPTALRAEGVEARLALQESVEALAFGEPHAAEHVVAGDERIDRRFREIEEKVFALLARQAPAATDLRFLTAVLHVALHLERIADMAANLATLTSVTAHLPPDPDLTDIVLRMGRRAGDMVEAATQALTVRSTKVAVEIVASDDVVDELEAQVFDAVLAAPDSRREWAVRILQASRYLERAADHAVDIAEEVAFLATEDDQVRN